MLVCTKCGETTKITEEVKESPYADIVQHGDVRVKVAIEERVWFIRCTCGNMVYCNLGEKI